MIKKLLLVGLLLLSTKAFGQGAQCIATGAPPTLTNGQLTVPFCDLNGQSRVSGTLNTISVTPTLTSVVCGSGSSSCVLKAASGVLYSVYATCTAACWLMVFNATALPANGATTAGVASGNMTECIPIASGGTGSVAFSGQPSESYSVGITSAISSTACASLTASTVGFVHGVVQ